MEPSPPSSAAINGGGVAVTAAAASSQVYLESMAVGETRNLVAELCRHFYTLGWVMGTGGSVTAKVYDYDIPKPQQLIVMSPSGVQKERMVPEDMFVLSSDGFILSAPCPKPYPNMLPKCTDCAPLFMKAYEMCNAGAVIHSHGMESCLVTMINPFSKEFRITHMEMIKGIQGHGYHDELVIPIIENTTHEGELTDSLTAAIRAYPKTTAVLVRNHGVFIWGDSWISAKTQAECYHYLFDAAIKLHQLGLDSSSPCHGPIRSVNVNGIQGCGGSFSRGVKVAALSLDYVMRPSQQCILLDIEGTKHLTTTYDREETQDDINLLRSHALAFPWLKQKRGEGPRMDQLPITRPDDWHLHLRDGKLLEAVVSHSTSHFGRAIVMPNLKPPITTTSAAVTYRESILKALPGGSDFTPLMTLYLTDKTTPDEIKLARKSGVVFAVKLYPAGATTNSQDGVTDLFGKCLPVLEEMVEQHMPLLVHGEVTDPNVDIFDREKVFIDSVLRPLIQRLPLLKVVMEHITTMDAVRFVESCKEGFVAATVTPQHLLLNRNSLFQGGLQPHNYCLPVLKREIHRQAIVSAVTSGSKRFFLGTDSAPHERRRKECPCGCAGIFNAPVALSLYAKVFEEAGALDKLEAFTSFNGPDFYGLPRNRSKIKLSRKPWKVPESFSFSFGDIIPMFAGETLEWKPSSI